MHIQGQTPDVSPHILPLQYLDISQILNIQNECGLAAWTKDQYQEEIIRENSFIYGANFKGEIVGFIAARLSITPSSRNKALEYAELDILNFGVIKKHQKQGIGNLLLDSLLKNESFGNLLQMVWLEVRESNLTAINFYKKRGFLKTQVRKNFYRQPTENAVVMKLNIPNLPVKVFTNT